MLSPGMPPLRNLLKLWALAYAEASLLRQDMKPLPLMTIHSILLLSQRLGGARSPNPQMSPKFVQVTSTFRGCQPSMTSLVYKNRIYSFRGSTNFRGCCHDRKKKSNRYFSTITSKQFSSQVMHASVTQRSEIWSQSTGSSRPSWAQEDTVWKKEKIAWKFAKQVELVQTYYCVL